MTGVKRSDLGLAKPLGESDDTGIHDAKAKVGAKKKAIADNQAKLATQAAKIADNETKVRANEAQIKANEKRIRALEKEEKDAKTNTAAKMFVCFLPIQGRAAI